MSASSTLSSTSRRHTLSLMSCFWPARCRRAARRTSFDASASKTVLKIWRWDDHFRIGVLCILTHLLGRGWGSHQNRLICSLPKSYRTVSYLRQRSADFRSIRPRMPWGTICTKPELSKTNVQRAFHYENKKAICVQGHCFETTDSDAIDNLVKLWVMKGKEKQELRGTRVSLSQAGSKLLSSLYARCR